MKPLKLCSARRAISTSSSPAPGIDSRNDFTACLSLRVCGADQRRARKLVRAPTFFEIDISLSFSTTIRFERCR
jgi:hypothetical protein